MYKITRLNCALIICIIIGCGNDASVPSFPVISSSFQEKSSSSSQAQTNSKTESSSNPIGPQSSSLAESSSSPIGPQSSSLVESSSSPIGPQSSSLAESSSSPIGPQSSSLVESSSSPIGPQSSSLAESSSSPIETLSSSTISMMSIYNATNNTLTDLRDNIVYKTVTIGDQVWMAENLNFEYQTGTNSFCYNDSEKFCNLYGRLYIEESKNNVCPENWHLPDSIEWKILFDFTGNKNEVLKANSSWSDWQNKDANGTNEYNFSVFAGGNKNRQTYSGYGTSATFWIKGSYWTVRITRINDNSPYYSLRDDFSAHAIRCIKDSE